MQFHIYIIADSYLYLWFSSPAVVSGHLQNIKHNKFHNQNKTSVTEGKKC
jgi:hypothetical protein